MAFTIRYKKQAIEDAVLLILTAYGHYDDK